MTIAHEAAQFNATFLRRNPSPYVSDSKTDKRAEGGQSESNQLAWSHFGRAIRSAKNPAPMQANRIDCNWLAMSGGATKDGRVVRGHGRAAQQLFEERAVIHHGLTQVLGRGASAGMTDDDLAG